MASAPYTIPEPRILIFDLETFPMLYYAWRPWKGRALEVLEYSKIISFSAKWLGGPQITKALPDYPRDADHRLTKDLWMLIDEADIIVAHNGRAFDFGRMNSQFLRHGLTPPAPAMKIDTKQVAKQVFGFDSNSLDNLAQFLGLGNKMPTGGWELWKECREGDPKAWAKMKKYNAHDVLLLEKIYLAMRPWMPRHPNVNLFVGQCPYCGSENVVKRGVRRTNTRVYPRYSCKDCGGWSRGTTSIRRSVITTTDV